MARALARDNPRRVGRQRHDCGGQLRNNRCERSGADEPFGTSLVHPRASCNAGRHHRRRRDRRAARGHRRRRTRQCTDATQPLLHLRGRCAALLEVRRAERTQCGFVRRDDAALPDRRTLAVRVVGRHEIRQLRVLPRAQGDDEHYACRAAQRAARLPRCVYQTVGLASRTTFRVYQPRLACPRLYHHDAPSTF